MLLGLQHRGHDAAGIAALHGGHIHVTGGKGLVAEALGSASPPKAAGLAIGHVRYSTSGGYEEYQPVPSPRGKLVIAYNGNIVNYVEAYRELLGGEPPQWDAAAVAAILERLYLEEGSLVDAVRAAGRLLRGAYSLVAATSSGELLAARDPAGIRPLAYSLGDGYVAVASESGVLSSMGLQWHELGAGTLLYCHGETRDCSVEFFAPTTGPYPCAFEYIYLMRPDSVFEGIPVHSARRRMGELLAARDDVDADLVVAVPDSGRSAAIGYASARGLPLDEAIYVNRFAGRSFIANPFIRSRIVEAKYSVVPGVVENKRVVAVDDSIVRGSTVRRIVRLLRAAGAREVHFRSAAPPVIAPCFFGVDIPTRSELIAHGRSVEEIAGATGADTVLYGTLGDLQRATGLPRLCMGCFTGDYPLKPLEPEFLESRFSRGRR